VDEVGAVLRVKTKEADGTLRAPPHVPSDALLSAYTTCNPLSGGDA